ncbi:MULTISPECIES: sugar ABC transporter ATP-binding protein [unclassified Mesorhizobium]|uniref:sugar ABC transporter ATP-binding protein n=1 Tax=unclassified Mesorhizobium TaxID=325217 RepID=UPI00112D77E9|nr:MULTISPECIES: sugar ABC transporter ATP-binding protein [unclassified Mesorhizobium]TPK52995.1 sugar ABC transporter ATP-binding protein [Mesorhizobium sp. B2-5-2]TPL17746.1 sugar ABC transporter ATP-binding protein [Mesorhizobium sp. B2-4-9]TPL21412.1 sugar ABC transporter ATP-binding protein [Mesorhizobium sp. B2-4-7]TPL43039.1 sugar ABC transporter ATP-binding protein [Mesorhizobium sp. B2-4-5]TPL55659.1 sugar ABC transporter ATP-binding protein [Mesorhizobium sp. B2-4-2]
MTSTTHVPAIAVNGIRKAFGATVALDDVSFAISPGSVHALLGENGAGKSTLVKLLSGLVRPDQGQISILGAPAALGSPRAAHERGVQTAFQEMTLVRDLSVLDNMLLPYAPSGPTGLIRRSAARKAVGRHIADLGFSVDLDAEVATLDLAVRQKIEIARAVYRKPRILLLDEPTSTLSGGDVEWLGTTIARLKAAGTTVVFITHRMREVRAFCDTLTILRNGRHIITAPVADMSDEDVIEKIIGRALAQTFPPKPEGAAVFGPPVLGVRDLKAGRKLDGASFDLRRGEILGIAGLQGMGQLDLFLACFGMAEIERGHVMVDGRKVWLGSPADALRPNMAIGLVPEDRKTEGLFLKLSGRQNASLPVVGRFTRLGLIREEEEARAVQAAFSTVEVDKRALWTRAGAFSGGNQQKIAIAKWLVAESRILLLFDPTRGIDVGTKHELYVMMRDYVAAGGSILLHSTEIPELVHQCDRVLVLYDGRLVAELAGDEITESAIMRPALGHDGNILEAAQ